MLVQSSQCDRRMDTQRLDQIVRRQRTRTHRDLVFSVALAILATLGLGALAQSARGATLAPISITSAR
jgi:hypothetical protein